MTKASAKRQSAVPASLPHPPIFYSLHALLHTVRLIQSHEDQLCTLMHEIETAGMPCKALLAELHEVLEQMPSVEYQADLEAVQQALSGLAAPPRVARKSPAKATKRAPKAGVKRAPKRPSKTVAKAKTKRAAGPAAGKRRRA